MFSRVDKGTFPKRRWKGVTKTLWSLEWLAQRAVPQVARKEKPSFPSSPMASVSRHCMPLACDCWMEQACLVLQDSTFLIAVEQQFSASAMMEAQLALASLMQVVCWASALLISITQWASASLVVQAQRVLASLMASVVSDSFWQRAILKSETCFLQWALREDLVTNRHLKALPTSSWSWITSPGRTLAPSPKVLTGREISLRVRSSGSASSGMLACGDTWEV